jgi:hypothetical protein
MSKLPTKRNFRTSTTLRMVSDDNEFMFKQASHQIDTFLIEVSSHYLGNLNIKLVECDNEEQGPIIEMNIEPEQIEMLHAYLGILLKNEVKQED